MLGSIQPGCTHCGATMEWEDADTLYCPSCGEYESLERGGEWEDYSTREEERDKAGQAIKAAALGTRNRAVCDGRRHKPSAAYRTPKGEVLLVLDCRWIDRAADGDTAFCHYGKVVGDKVRMRVMDERFLERCSRTNMDVILWRDAPFREFYDEVFANQPYDYAEEAPILGNCECCGAELELGRTTYWCPEVEDVVMKYEPTRLFCPQCGQVDGEEEE